MKKELNGEVTWAVNKISSDGSAVCTMTIDWMVVTDTLPDDVKETLLGETAPLTQVYQLSFAQERGEWTELGRLAHETGTRIDQIAQTYYKAVE